MLLADIGHTVQRPGVYQRELHAVRRYTGRCMEELHTCTWFETIEPGPSSVHISSVLIVSKLQSPTAEITPSSLKSRRWFNATKYPLSE